MMSPRDVFFVEKWRPLTINPLPGASGLLGFMVATSNIGLASAGIGLSRVGGSGIVHAVSLVARFRFRGSGEGPWVPVIELPSVFSFPSYVPPIPAIDIFTVEPWRVI